MTAPDPDELAARRTSRDNVPRPITDISKGMPNWLDMSPAEFIRAVAKEQAWIDTAQVRVDQLMAFAVERQHEGEHAMIDFDVLQANGHDGRCDHDDGPCNYRPEFMVAEATKAECACGRCDRPDVSAGVYCTAHIGEAPRATLDQAQHAARLFDAPWWPALLDAYPEPIQIVGHSELQPATATT